MAKPLYAPLPFYGYIRLLSIESSTGSDRIQCRLHAARLDHPPTYYALSYVWGDQNSHQEILCNGQPIRVSKNLSEALRKIRERTAQLTEKARKNQVVRTLGKLGRSNKNGSPPYLIWIDALCIDQSNFEECSDQVKLMRQIYSSAREVLIWLGPADEETGLAMSMLRKAAAYWKRYENTFQGPRLPNMSDLSPRGIKKSLRLPDLKSSDWDALERMFARPWFSRIWIVQEATMASTATLMIGDLEISWETVNEAGKFARHIQPLFKHPYREFKGLDVSHLMYILRNKVKHARLSLVDLLRHTRHFGATDPRDKVFALLGLSVEGTDMVPHQISPNYGATTLNVYRDATVSIIQNTRSLEVLSHAVYSESDDFNGFPSWVPRWDQPELGQSWSSKFKEKYYASGNRTIQYYHSADRSLLTLTVGGLSFDTIRKVSDILWSPICHISPGVFRKIDNPIWKIWADMVRPLKTYPTGDSITKAFTIAFLGGLDADGTKQRRAIEYSLSHMNYWTRFINQSYSLHGTLSVIDSELMGLDEADIMVGERRNDFHHDPGHFFSSGVDWDNDTVFKNPETRFFTTERGYMGVGVRQIETGDKVCVLFGNKVPIVLRPFGLEYKLVGECITHGIMKGEFLEEWQRANRGKDCERFIIR